MVDHCTIGNQYLQKIREANSRMEYFKSNPSGNGEPPENKRNKLHGDGRGVREQNCRDWEKKNELNGLLALLITLP